MAGADVGAERGDLVAEGVVAEVTFAGRIHAEWIVAGGIVADGFRRGAGVAGQAAGEAGVDLARMICRPSPMKPRSELQRRVALSPAIVANPLVHSTGSESRTMRTPYSRRPIHRFLLHLYPALAILAIAEEAAPQATELRRGRMLAETIAAGDTVRYTVDADENDFLLGEVNQISVDVTIRILGPDGVQIGRFGGLGRGPERFKRVVHRPKAPTLSNSSKQGKARPPPATMRSRSCGTRTSRPTPGSSPTR